MTKDELITKYRTKYGKIYDYSLVPDNVTYNTKITLNCDKMHPWGEPHGCFPVQVGKHLLRGDGCTKCSGKYKRAKEDFVKEATFIHKGLYTYEDFVWKGTDKNGIIHCTKHHLNFKMTPNHHLHGQGCPKCRYEKASKTKTKEQSVFIEQAKEIYSNFYDYSETVYVNDKTIIDIICPIHGKFRKPPNAFLHGHDCQECSKLRRIQKRTYTTEKFIEKAQKKHNNFYSYEKTNYKKGELEVIVTCPIHGDFNIIACNHLFGQGCKKCSSFRSKGEREVEEFVKSLGFEVETTNRKILNGEEIDICIPSKNVAIEYNGLRWHSEEFKGKNYHLNKTIQCQKQGIQLIHIFEDEWKNKCEIVKSYIKPILGINEINLTSDGYTIQYISAKETKQFIKNNCLEEYHNSSIKIGVIQKEQLISIMTFKKVSNENTYQIVQYCNKVNYNITNSIKIILDNFINTYKPSVIIVNVDRRYNNSKLYEEFGFIQVGETKPLCYYIQDYQRNVKFVQNALKIYDCGKICYEYKIEYIKNKHEK